MNAISKALDEIKYRIPMPILMEVFTDKFSSWRDTPISIDEQILHRVIKPRVLVDCNLVGGDEVFIPLENLQAERIDNFTTVYHISKDKTQGRSILSVLSVSFTAPSYMGVAGALGGVKPGSVTPVLNAGMAVMDAMSPMPITSTAKVQVIAENTIMIRDTSPLIANAYIRCILSNDENMNNIQIRAIPNFCILVTLAVKSFIYNESIIFIDMAKLSGGQELGRFKEIVDSYSEAEELYQDFLKTKWAKTALFNDREATNRLIKMMIGSLR